MPLHDNPRIALIPTPKSKPPLPMPPPDDVALVSIALYLNCIFLISFATMEGNAHFQLLLLYVFPFKLNSLNTLSTRKN